MSKYELKTKKTTASVQEFINAVEDPKKKEGSFILLKLMEEITKKKADFWGNSIIGFGTYHYKSKSGIEGKWPVTGFSPRKQNFTVYIMDGFSKYQSLLKKIGKYKIGSSCLYFNKLENIELDILRQIIEKSVINMKKLYKCD